MEEHGFVRVHMGKPIKDMLAALGLTEMELSGPPEARSAPAARLMGKSSRFAMQTLGTDWGRRMISPHIWADALEHRVGHMRSQGIERIVIDDLRFPEDFAALSRLGGTMVRIIRPGISRNLRLADHLVMRWPWSTAPLTWLGVSLTHETEIHWHSAPASFEIVNNANLDVALNKLLSRLVELPSSA